MSSLKRIAINIMELKIPHATDDNIVILKNHVINATIAAIVNNNISHNVGDI